MPPIVPGISCGNPDAAGMGVVTGIDVVVVIGTVGVGMAAVVMGTDDAVVIKDEGGLGLGGGLLNGLLLLEVRLIDFDAGGFGLTGFDTGADSASSPDEGLRCK